MTSNTENEPLPPTLLAVLTRNRFGMLLFALLLMFLIGPCLDWLNALFLPIVPRVGMAFGFFALLLSAVFAVGQSRRQLVIVTLLACPALILEAVGVWLESERFDALTNAFDAVFLSYVIVVLMRFIFVARRVTTNMVFASACVYLLLAVLWALLYSLLAEFDENAFLFNVGENAGQSLRFATGNSIYFSVVTMTTLGYGDIVPVSSGAQSLAALQAIIGQLYLTVLVARLVGLHIVHARG